MALSREERRLNNVKQNNIDITAVPPSPRTLAEGEILMSMLPTKQLGLFAKYKGKLWRTYLTHDGNVYVDKDLIVNDSTRTQKAIVRGKTEFNGDLVIKEGKKIYFDSTDTYIYANTDDPEDLVIGADQDIILEPDNHVLLTSDMTVTVDKKIYFDTTATSIYANTDNPEDLVITSNEDIILEPDGDVLLVDNNMVLGGASYNASAKKTLILGTGTEPSGLTDGEIYIGSKDIEDQGSVSGLPREATLMLYSERVPESAGGIFKTVDATHKLIVWINGTEYYIGLKEVGS